MAARKRKPAIGNVARPEGWLDDVVYPAASRVLRSKPVKKATSGRSRKVAARYEERRMNMYSKKATDAEDRIDYLYDNARTTKARKQADKKSEKLSKQYHIQSRKSDMMNRFWTEGGPRNARQENKLIRKAAKRGRAAYKAERADNKAWR